MNDKNYIIVTERGDYFRKFKRGGFFGQWFFTDNPKKAKRFTQSDANKVRINMFYSGRATTPVVVEA